MRHRIVPLLLCAGILGGADRAVAENELPPPVDRQIDFGRDIQPLFAENCHGCHGPQKQKSQYRLDLREVALNGGESGERPIVPGKSADSPLIKFVAGLDPDLVMPPPKSDQKRLSAEQIGLLRAWIDQGAIWPDAANAQTKDRREWWSFKPIVRTSPPPTTPEDASWSRNPIDAFIAAKLRENGLKHSPEADRRTLIRRLYFDLIGLPPAPDVVDAFVADTDPHSYEKLVDRLLASPRYGERWARHWLDVVHFGETHGYDKDKPRPNAWPYRDYVIRAFNSDKPYAQFVQEQIAGDVLSPGTTDGIEALGFIAAGPWDYIGHAELPESKIDGKIARHLDRDDMVSNTINTFSSLTIHCAQCHDHKFDPITQEDYYSLQAVFAAVDRADKKYYTDPALTRRRAELEDKLRTLAAEKRGLDEKIKIAAGAELTNLDQQITETEKQTKQGRRPEYGYHSAIAADQETEKWVQVDLGRSVTIDKVVLAPCDDDFNGIGPGFGYPRRFHVDICDDPSFLTNPLSIVERQFADSPNPGTAPQTFSARGKTGRFVRVTATRLAPRQNDFIFALAELESFDASGRNLAVNMPVTSFDTIEAAPRWARTNLVDGVYPAGNQNNERLAQLRESRAALIERSIDAATRIRLEACIAALGVAGAELEKMPPPEIVYAGTVHHGEGPFTGTGPNGGKPRPIFLLARGDVTRPGKAVTPRAPEAFAMLPGQFDLADDAPEEARRAALAQWLTDSRNPLAWRSIVNRIWQGHFGRAIVDTPNDFGHMGQLPTHPELLDWLAAEFRDRGQSIKQLHRLIVTSATYRQSSAAEPMSEAIDASNGYLWRQHRRRLEAEAIRDSILAVAGQLDLTMGGPSFQDFVIEKPENSPHYKYQLADPENRELHRRSIYRFIVRSQQQPWMAAMDCADPSMLVDKRNETITALQALAQLNNQLMLVMAKHFAARLDQPGRDTGAKVQEGFRLALARSPEPAELSALTAYANDHGLINACRALINLNEFVFID